MEDAKPRTDEPAMPPRVVRWTQKLLDLSTRNRLLNVREGKFAIPILCPEVGKMEDFLAAGKPLVVGSISRLLGSVDVNEIRNRPEVKAALKTFGGQIADIR